MKTDLRPMSTGELLDRTFFLYRRYFVLFVGIAALPHLALLMVQIAGMAAKSGPSHAPVRPGAALSFVAPALITGLLYLLALAASHAATVAAVSAVHLERPISIGKAYGFIKGRIPHFLLIMIGLWMGIGVGLILLVVPGIILALRWSLTIPVAVLENKGLREATARSAQLAKGARERIFVIYVLFIVLYYVVTLLWSVPLGAVIGVSVGLHHRSFPVLIQLVSVFSSFVTNCLVGPLLTIALSLLYYDQRVRKEAFDLQLMMANLNVPQSGALETPTP
jgi:hypothetical protein